MQPYFFPYTGYFRLFSHSDLFIVLDTVQFPRRGWVHRNRLLTTAGEPAWLTLPLAKTERDATIDDQHLVADALAILDERTRRFPALGPARARQHPVCRELFRHETSLVDYLVRQLEAVCAMLGLTTPMIRASDLPVEPSLRGADRLIALAQAVGADTCVNAPGGRELYSVPGFAARGIRLEFLPPYTGPAHSILQRVLDEPLTALRRSLYLD